MGREQEYTLGRERSGKPILTLSVQENGQYRQAEYIFSDHQEMREFSHALLELGGLAFE